jgi:hypothetical protein
LASGNWRVQVRRKTRYVAETFRRRKDGEEWALEMERNIDRNGSAKPRAVRNIRTFGDLINLHDEDMREVGKPPRRSKAAVMASLKTELGIPPATAPSHSFRSVRSSPISCTRKACGDWQGSSDDARQVASSLRRAPVLAKKSSDVRKRQVRTCVAKPQQQAEIDCCSRALRVTGELRS